MTRFRFHVVAGLGLDLAILLLLAGLAFQRMLP